MKCYEAVDITWHNTWRLLQGVMSRGARRDVTWCKAVIQSDVRSLFHRKSEMRRMWCHTMYILQEVSRTTYFTECKVLSTCHRRGADDSRVTTCVSRARRTRSQHVSLLSTSETQKQKTPSDVLFSFPVTLVSVATEVPLFVHGSQCYLHLRVAVVVSMSMLIVRHEYIASETWVHCQWDI